MCNIYIIVKNKTGSKQNEQQGNMFSTLSSTPWYLFSLTGVTRLHMHTYVVIMVRTAKLKETGWGYSQSWYYHTFLW